MDARDQAMPLRMHFITDSDRGYTLSGIRSVRGSDIIYAELHERPTDERPQRVLPAIAIMRTADDLPTVGRPFSPEIVTDLTRGTTVLRTGRVEVVTEEDAARAHEPA
jgi:hypothetical protein